MCYIEKTITVFTNPKCQIIKNINHIPFLIFLKPDKISVLSPYYTSLQPSYMMANTGIASMSFSVSLPKTSNIKYVLLLLLKWAIFSLKITRSNLFKKKVCWFGHIRHFRQGDAAKLVTTQKKPGHGTLSDRLLIISVKMHGSELYP